jgi:acetoin utilization deacetylase AcuC-like enzyme
MKIYYSDIFPIPLPANHRFPLAKYQRLREKVSRAEIIPARDFCIPRRVTREEILRVHDAGYVDLLLAGEMTEKEMRRIGFPWSPALIERTLRSAGATLQASFAALNDKMAVCLSGGTHHAFNNHGEGYCLINDCAIAAEAVIDAGKVERVLIIDCDVHQGNGTAAIFSKTPDVYTFSIHGQNNYPYRKEASDLDIAIEDDSEDGEYLTELARGLRKAVKAADAGLAIYLAGADPYRDDRFGRLALSKKGLLDRDHMIYSQCLSAGMPVVTTMAGGYAHRIDDTVDIHFQTVKTAALFNAGRHSFS